jgi:hypothetical protein
MIQNIIISRKKSVFLGRSEKPGKSMLILKGLCQEMDISF